MKRRRALLRSRWSDIHAGVLAAILLFGSSIPARAASQLSDQVVPLDSFPQQPESPLQIGTPFLETGPISAPFELPTGAVWQPSLMTFGTLRTALQTFHNGVNPRISEWTNQDSLYGSLQLTGTERVLVELRPADNYRNYFSQEFEPKPAAFHDREYGDVREAFFEGDFDQLFPRLDPYDRYGLDYGFSVGRQPLLLQDGLLLDDTIDSIGVIRNHILSPSFPPLRILGFSAGTRFIVPTIDATTRLVWLQSMLPLTTTLWELSTLMVSTSRRALKRAPVSTVESV